MSGAYAAKNSFEQVRRTAMALARSPGDASASTATFWARLATSSRDRANDNGGRLSHCISSDRKRIRSAEWLADSDVIRFKPSTSCSRALVEYIAFLRLDRKSTIHARESPDASS